MGIPLITYNVLQLCVVADLMQKPVITINGEEAVIHLAEQMAVDVEAVYPVSDQGIATAFSLKSLNERARMHKANKPHHYPVLLQGQLAGMVSRHDVMLALCGLVGERQVAVEDNRKSA